MKKWIAAFLVFCSLCTALPVFADDSYLIADAGFYMAQLYYCDAEAGVVVLKNVTPVGERNNKNTEISQKGTYQELSIAGAISLPDGNSVPLSDCNLYADSQVRILLIRTKGETLHVINMKFL